MKAHDRQVYGLNPEPGDWSASMRGRAVDPVCCDAFRKSVEESLKYAKALQAPHVHLMTGNAPAIEQNRGCYIENITLAADRFTLRDTRF